MGQIPSIKDRLSWWEYEYLIRNVDYTVVGAGIVGLSTAISLKKAEPQSKVLILDKKRAPIGASTKNAGFACFGSVSEIFDDFTTYGEAICRKLIKMRWSGLSLMKSRIPKDKMKYNPTAGAEIFENEKDYTYYREKLTWANSLVADIVKDDQCYYSQIGLFGNEIINGLEGSLNPQMMMNELESIARKEGVMMMLGMEVEGIDYSSKVINTESGTMTYNKLIICTNGFSNSLLSNVDIRPARNQVLITKKIPGFELKHCYHMNKGFVYFRSYEERLLIGGGRDLDMEGETTEKLGTTELIMTYLNNIVQKHILQDQPYEIEHTWSGILGVGDSKMPVVKFVDNDVLVAVRMGGMGVAVGSFIGEVASSMILSNDNTAHKLYVS